MNCLTNSKMVHVGHFNLHLEKNGLCFVSRRVTRVVVSGKLKYKIHFYLSITIVTMVKLTPIIPTQSMVMVELPLAILAIKCLQLAVGTQIRTKLNCSISKPTHGKRKVHFRTALTGL